MLDIHPFMVEIRDALLQAVSAMEPSDARKTPHFHVFVGHDTVVAPVLTALGVYSHKEFCGWPNLASRIAFEVWLNTRTQEPYVRVVYNGKDVTALVTSCSTSNALIRSPSGSDNTVRSNGPDSAKYALCPLRVFVGQIDKLLHPHDSTAEACALK